MELIGDGAIGRALRDEVDNLEFGIGEAVPARLRPRVADDAPFDAQPAQRAADPARVGVRFEAA